MSKNDLQSMSVAQYQLETASSLQSLYYSATKNNTRRAYQNDIKRFEGSGFKLPCLESDVLKYIALLCERLNPKTLQRHVLSVKHWHVSQGLNDPTSGSRVKQALKGALNRFSRPGIKAEAMTEKSLHQMVDDLLLQKNKRSIRNRALLLTGFYGACRRSELSGFHWEDIQFVNEGVILRFRGAKGDKAQLGERCSIPSGKTANYCPIQALLDWQMASGHYQGPVFREIFKNDRVGEKAIQGQQVNRIVQCLAKRLSLPNVNGLSAHSLRRGFATEAFRKGAPLNLIKNHGRWKSLKTVLEYLEDARLFVDSPVSVFFK